MEYEILGTIVQLDEIVGAAIGAVIGALIIAFTCYVVAKVKHDYDVREEMNDCRLDGAVYPDWRAAKASTWYTGYKLALVVLFAISTMLALFSTMVLFKYGYVQGAIECAAAAAVFAICEGLVVDMKIVHPIADGKFMEKVETPLVDAFLQPDTPAAEDPKDELVRIAAQLKEKGLI